MALVSIVVGLAGMVAILGVLRVRHGGNLPDGDQTIQSGKVAASYRGTEIVIDVPPTNIKAPDEKKKLEAIIAEQIKNNPKVAAAEKIRFDKWKTFNQETRLAQLDAMERQQLEKVANSNLTEQEKAELSEEITKRMQTNKEQTEKLIAETPHK